MFLAQGNIYLKSNKTKFQRGKPGITIILIVKLNKRFINFDYLLILLEDAKCIKTKNKQLKMLFSVKFCKYS